VPDPDPRLRRAASARTASTVTGPRRDVPDVLEGQGGRPGQQHRGIQAPAADGGQGERAHNDGTGGESGGVRGEVAAALDAGGQVDDLLAGMHGPPPYRVM
jgi:hypothetical protein